MTEPKADDGQAELKRSEYLAERGRLIDIELEMCKSNDSTMVLVAGGALTLSLSYLATLKRAPADVWLLVGSWIAFAISLCGTLVSHQTSMLSLRRQRDMWDAYYEKPDTTPKATSNALTNIMNWSALVSLAIGVVLVVSFAVANIRAGTVFANQERQSHTCEKGAFHARMCEKEEGRHACTETTKACAPTPKTEVTTPR